MSEETEQEFSSDLDYYFLVASGSDNLSEKVQEKLDKGYIIHGSPVLSQVCIDNKVRVLMGQAVVSQDYIGDLNEEV